MPKRQYTEREKGVALAYYDACGKNAAKTARDCKLPRQTVMHWLRGEGTGPGVTEVEQQQKEALDVLLEREARAALAAAANVRDEATYQQLITGLAIAVDKMRLLREQSTSITESRELTREERANRLADELARLGLGIPGEISRTAEPAEPIPD